MAKTPSKLDQIRALREARFTPTAKATAVSRAVLRATVTKIENAIVTALTQTAPIVTRGGRAKVYASGAEKQRAYRERKANAAR